MRASATGTRSLKAARKERDLRLGEIRREQADGIRLAEGDMEQALEVTVSRGRWTMTKSAAPLFPC
jgi:hypothetical protein